ncbi:MAG: DUF1615 domain-containing protein [Pseudomonadota bacterium]
MAENLRRFALLGAALLLAGCATTEFGPQLPGDLARRPDGSSGKPWSTSLEATEVRTRITRLLPGNVKDRSGWAADFHTAYEHLKIPHAAETYCATLAVVEQESTYQVDPAVPNLPAIVRRELDRRAGKYGIPKLIIAAVLKKSSPDGRSYDERIDALKTEKQLNALFEDMSGELPFGKQLLADYNPVRTAGPMQVSIEFAERHAQEKAYPYPVAKTLRDEVFTRRGGLYFGAAILLDYPAPYDDVVYRFADFNAGRYASRNAAFQAALNRISGKSLALDGDLLRYDDDEPSDVPSQVESALVSMSTALNLSAREIRRDLLREKSAGFGATTLYERVFALADRKAGQPLPRQAMPRIALSSPKIIRKLTTEWFATRVAERYKRCLARAD